MRPTRSVGAVKHLRRTQRPSVVPLTQSVKLAEALRRAGVEVTLQVYHGGGLGGRAFTSPESWRAIEEFFARRLRPE